MEKREKSYEALMERKLAAIDDRRDRRQGSLIFDALAPNAAETAAFYAELDLLEDRTFGDTATGADLERRTAERGILRKQAVKATFYGRFLDREGQVYPLENGTRFLLEDLAYRVLFQAEDGRYVLECETAGACGNERLGELLPEKPLTGLAKASLEELRTDGEDAEGDEELRKRYFSSFDADAFGGNIADYQRRVTALQNVGGVRVYPVWQGGGTVKLVILDQGGRKPTETELQALQQAIDPRSRGEGYGLAPIGHRVTVVGVEERPLQIQMVLTLTEGALQETVTAEIRKRYEAYFAELRKSWADGAALTVRISYLEAKALEVAGVVDISGCRIDGREENYTLGADEIPILGEIKVMG